ncbi:restriction endonuclease subunit S [Pseudobutyrivibrio sp. LB2011]|uniref:restriction endonuclease subunit S n=1 Tax=Pseudobutyrivibrio sp. LB2011 TaxID=1408312 RepID=UPI0005D2532A|nr:restriction endonuclease subunit S [Pseudobutyrivibrio sp. LB2011]
MTPEQLKASILQMAIKGKLVEQRSEEGTAEELYQEIQDEKQRLIKEGKIKKEKPLAEITEDEIPFDIPESWKWYRLGDLIKVQNGYAYKSEEMNKDEKGMPVIKSGNLMSLSVQLKPRNDYIEHPTEKMLESKIVKGDMLMCLSSQSDNPEPLGKTAVYESDKPALLNQRVLKMRPFIDEITYYLYYVINTEYFHYNVSHQGGGSAQANLKMSHVLNMLVPIPPLQEQHRIVVKIEELLPYVDRYAEAYEKLEQFNAKFPEDMKKSILQYAIQGKLVEQRTEEGNAEEQYQQIQEEKQKLIKEGKIKKEKPLSEITADEIPFDIPETWKWIRFGEIYKLTNGLASRGKFGKPMCPVLRLADLSNDRVNTSDVRLLGIDEKEKNSHLVKKDDLIFIRVNGTRDRVGRAYLYDGDNEISYCDHLFCGHALVTSIDVKYIQYIFNSHFIRCQLNPEIKTTAGQNTISQGSMNNIILPLPPYNEQKRIAAKIEELMPYCDKLIR